MIRSYRTFPKELFRINKGPRIYLRPWTNLQPRRFDVFLENGHVEPKALSPKTYKAPNGMSMRPNSPYQQDLAGRFQGPDALVYAVPRGNETNVSRPLHILLTGD